MENKTCFVIAPIGEEDSDVRKRSDQVLKHIISPAVEHRGYNAIRADQISEPGMITSQVIQHIVDDPLVIADLTGRNANVFYELAIRHALQKPLVQILKKGEQLPFDVAGSRTVFVDHRDLDSVQEAKSEIIGQIEALESDSASIETPISISLDLQFLKQSDDPEERSLGDLIATVSEMRTSLAALEKKLDDPESILPPDYVRFITQNMRHRSGISKPLRYQLGETISRIEKKNLSSSTRDEEVDYLVNQLKNLVDITD